MSNIATQTKLPTQVQKINEAVNAAIKAGTKTEGKPALVAEPAKSASKIDQEDYKTRFVNYKKATDTTISELRTTLASVQATLATVQNQQSMTAAIKPDVIAPVIVDTSSTLTKESPVYKQYLDRLPSSIKNEYTEDYLFDQFVIQSSLSDGGQSTSQDLSTLEAKIDNVVSFQDKTRAQLYEEEMDSLFPNDEWITLASGEEWKAFCLKRVSAVDSRTYGDIVGRGSEEHAAAAVAWVLNEFKASKQPTLDTDKAIDPLLSQITPDGAGTGGGDPIEQINARAETFKRSEVIKFYTDWSKGDYTPEEAADIEKSIIAADKAGQIVEG